MALSERELRILRDIEDSLQDCERQWAAIERRMQGRNRRWWLLGLCIGAPVIGTCLIVLGAMTVHGGILLALFGSALIAIPFGCANRLRNDRQPQRMGLDIAPEEREY
jgi:DUF3040 family protein